MKWNYSCDPDPCGEDYTGQPPDDDQSFIVPRRGLEPDSGPDDEPMIVERRSSPADTDSLVFEEDMGEYPDEFPDNSDEPFVSMYEMASKQRQEKRKKKQKKKTKKKANASSEGVDLLELAAFVEGVMKMHNLPMANRNRQQRGGLGNHLFARWKKNCLKKRTFSIGNPCYTIIMINTMKRSTLRAL